MTREGVLKLGGRGVVGHNVGKPGAKGLQRKDNLSPKLNASNLPPKLYGYSRH